MNIEDYRDYCLSLGNDVDEKLQNHYRKFCSLCGNYKHYQQNAGNFIPRCEKEPFRNIVSKTWHEIYKNC